MLITIEDKDWDADLYALAGKALRLGSKPTPTPSGTVYEIYDDKVVRAEFNALRGKPVELDAIMAWVIVPVTALDNLVNTKLPDCKYIDEDGEEQRRNNTDYFSRSIPIKSADGTQALVPCCYRKYGADNPIYNKLTQAELDMWVSAYGDVLITQDRTALLATDEWKQEGQV